MKRSEKLILYQTIVAILNSMVGQVEYNYLCKLEKDLRKGLGIKKNEKK